MPATPDGAQIIPVPSGQALLSGWIGNSPVSFPMLAPLTANQGCAIPPAMPWDNVNYPLNISVSPSGIGSAGLDLMSFFPDWQTLPRWYVDPTRPDDSGNGLTPATAKRTISAAVALQTTAAVRGAIWCKGGFYNRNRTFSAGTIFPTQDAVFVAYGGTRAVVTSAELGLTWTANATYSWVSQATRSNCSRVVNPTLKDNDGFYRELTKLVDLVSVSRTPGSWTEVAGVCYVFPFDGSAVTDTNTRVYLAVDNLRMQGTSQQSILLMGETLLDGFDLEGGQSGAWRTTYTGGASGARVVQGAINCTFRYSGHSTGAVGGVAIEGLNGLAYFINCDASNGVTDCWNFHNVLGASMYVLTVNCSGIRGGQFSYTSCNGWTGHDTVIAIDVCGIYDRNKGRTIHFIDNSRVFLAGTKISGSLGDKPAGGANEPGELTAENTVQMWGDLCTIGNLSGQLAVTAYDTSTIRLTRSTVRGTNYSAANAVYEIL